MTSIASRLKKLCSGHDEEWYAPRLEYMMGFLTEERVEVLRRTLSQRTRYMTILTENTFHPQKADTCGTHGNKRRTHFRHPFYYHPQRVGL